MFDHEHLLVDRFSLYVFVFRAHLRLFVLYYKRVVEIQQYIPKLYEHRFEQYATRGVGQRPLKLPNCFLDLTQHEQLLYLYIEYAPGRRVLFLQ